MSDQPVPPISDASVDETTESFAVVGIGASAGGLAAFEAFFSSMPPDPRCGLALVLVQHLDPDHTSILAQLVRRYTSMPVHEVEDGMEVQPNRVYIIPPNRDLALLGGTLQLLEPHGSRGHRHSIDFFFRSLASELQERAIGIVLSGTGSDGTLGLRAIKGEGGLTIAQEPESASFDGMPRSAIASELVDFVLPAEQMLPHLLTYVSHAEGRFGSLTAHDVRRKVCVLLRAQTGHDFSQYKSTTVSRRIERRMALQQIARSSDYLRFLRETPSELEALFRDLLIGVTAFFRDPEAFEALEALIPQLFAGKAAGEAVRIWVTGCSTGEEAYSIAILVQEHLATLERHYKVQIFATDIDARAIAQARRGIVTGGIAADVTPERLERFFERQDDGSHRLVKSVRDLLIFSEQDLIRDPPFSRLDLISCRNVLIYMDAALQQRLMPLFHYALEPGGLLFLGSSETVGDHAPLFSTLQRKWKIYERQPVQASARPSMGELVRTPALGPAARARQVAGRAKAAADLRSVTERALLEQHEQVGVLVTARGEILYIHGRTGKYLEPAPGDAGLNILAMSRPGLRRELTTALHRAVAHREVVRYSGLQVRTNGDSVTIDLVVRALPPEGDDDIERYLVSIKELPAASDGEAGADAAPEAGAEVGGLASSEAEERLAVLAQELSAKDDYLQTTIEEMETANEELRSVNEEMQSVNEELQSTNEELETSKEELQSVNEELATVNAELQAKVADLSRVNNDMNNLLAGTGVGTLFVDCQLRISRFTPAATQVINLIPADVGRPVGHIVSNLRGYDSLVEDARQVLESLMPREVEVQSKGGPWYLMRMRPYRTLENVIEGVVLTFVDISEQKALEGSLRAARALVDDVVATLREPFLLLDAKLRVLRANQAFCRYFAVSLEETEGRFFYDLGERQLDVPELRAQLQRLIGDESSERDNVEDQLLEGEFAGIGRRRLMLNARRVRRGDDEPPLILLAIDDATARADSVEQLLAADGAP